MPLFLGQLVPRSPLFGSFLLRSVVFSRERVCHPPSSQEYVSSFAQATEEAEEERKLRRKDARCLMQKITKNNDNPAQGMHQYQTCEIPLV